MPIRVTHVISGLKQGGAQEMLLKLLQEIAPGEVAQSVISLTAGGAYCERIESLGVSVNSIGLKRRTGWIWGIRRLVAAMRRSQPDVIQTWMYHADLLGGFAARLLRPRPPVVWNVRHGNLERGVDRWSTRVIARVCAWTSRQIPAHIVVNSVCGRAYHVGLGYSGYRMGVIPNGFDIARFRPSPAAGAAFRRQHEIPLDAPVVGQFARYHPLKDYPALIQAADLILARRPETHFVLCGDAISLTNSELAQMIQKTRNPKRFHLLGERRDIFAVNSCLDVAVLSSVSEGFPNVIGEAMACGVPCVVTDVGDAAFLVGNAGFVVPPRQPQALAEGCLTFLMMDRDERSQWGARARNRICRHFSIAEVSRSYLDVWRQAARIPEETRKAAA